MNVVYGIISRFNLGRAKIWMTRLQAYLNIIQFLMVAWIAIQGHLNIWLIVAAMMGAGIVLYLDILHIYPKEASYGFSKTPEFVQMKNDIREIKEMLNKEVTK